MKIKSAIALFSLALSIAACSLPSMPWSKSTPTDPTAEALFEEGTRNFNDRRYVRAIDSWQKLKTEHPFSPLVTQTELKIADAYYLNKQYPEAIAAFKEFQALHPLNENIPFVLYRLGQAHFDQFTSVDRDQKNTEIAKSYFENVITNHPKSAYAIEAREKLAKTIEYLADHDFNVAQFYFKQEKFPAARDRFEEIVRKYRDTPTAVKSLFYLGECHRKEKNGIKAALAYEALIQHYPQSKFAAEAKTQLAQVEKEKHDPLAMLLMRDRRPAPAPENSRDPALAKLKELNLVAKKDVVYEEPGDEKGFLRKVVDKINPFSSSSSDTQKQEKKPETGSELLAQKKAAEKESSGGVLAWLNPFSGGGTGEKKPAAKNTGLVGQIDDSLKQKGIDAGSQTAALKPPEAALPNVETAAPATMDTSRLLGQIDDNLKKSGKSAGELPPAPQAAEVFKDGVAAQEAITKATAKPRPSESPITSGLLSSIDQKLKGQGVEPSQVALPAPAENKNATAKQPPKTVELEPKLSIEKGPLFMSPAEISLPERDAASPTQDGTSESPKTQEPAGQNIPRAVVRGPAPIQPATVKPPEPRKTSPADEDEPKKFLEQLRQDAESVGKILNPFSW